MRSAYLIAHLNEASRTIASMSAVASAGALLRWAAALHAAPHARTIASWAVLRLVDASGVAAAPHPLGG